MFLKNINGNTMKSRPFLTADGWVWFRGSDDALWRVLPDGTQQSRPGNKQHHH